MNKLAALALVLAASTQLAGCIPLGCGGYSGGDDRVYARGADSLILCDNGGFVATNGSATIEGRLEDDAQAAVTTGVEGDDDATIFTYSDGDLSTDALTTTGFGSAAWTEQTENQVSLDHANVRCTDLTTRTWWNTGA